MGKNNSEKSVKKNAATLLAEATAKIEALKAQLAQATEEATAADSARVEEVKGLIESLPELFGLESDTEAAMLGSLSMINGYINGRRKGTLGSLRSVASGERKAYVRLTPVQTAEIDAALKAGTDPIIARSRALSDKYGCCFQTVYLRAGALGLTAKRAVAPVVA